jgi:spore coat protein U-like protein
MGWRLDERRRKQGLRHCVHGIVAALILLLGATDRACAMACSVTSFTGAYGAVDILAGAAVNSTASFTATCSGGSANQAIRFCLNIGPGTTATGPSGERVLRSSSTYLDHEFYFDSGHTQLWGSWGISSSSSYPSGSPKGIQQDVTLDGTGAGTFNYTVYGSVLASQQTTKPGSFTWSGSEPTVQYVAKSGASACPTSGGSASAGGSSFTATINDNCNISASTMNFGSSASIISANIDSTATITAQCTNTTPYSIGLDNGTNASGSQNRMRLGATSNYINYDLYTDSARAHAWATTSSTTSCTGGASTCVLGTGTGSNQNTTIYGRVPSQTAPASGIFIDTVVMTVTY